MFSALIGVLLGGIITWTMTFYLKARDIKVTARNNAFLISLTLAEQYSTLASVSAFVDLIKNQEAHQACILVPSLMSIQNDVIGKVLTYHRIFKFPEFGSAIHSLMLAQRLYEYVFLFVAKYNSSLSTDTLAIISQKKEEKIIDEHYQGLLLETATSFAGIIMKLNEAKVINEKAREKFNVLCGEIFNEPEGWCEKAKEFWNESLGKLKTGFKYKPPTVEDKIIKVDEF